MIDGAVKEHSEYWIDDGKYLNLISCYNDNMSYQME